MIVLHYFCLIYFKAIMLISFVHLSYFPTPTSALNCMLSHLRATVYVFMFLYLIIK